jgi:hypothetical protein
MHECALSSKFFQRNFFMRISCYLTFHAPGNSRLGNDRLGRLRSKLAEKFDYQNTYYHEEPRLDIAAASIAPGIYGEGLHHFLGGFGTRDASGKPGVRECLEDAETGRCVRSHCPLRTQQETSSISQNSTNSA